MLSESRFATQAQDMGLLPSGKTTTALNLVLRELPAQGSGGEAPLTRPVREAPKGVDGFDIDGYQDYRGVRVIGAWTWLPDHDIGLVTEVDTEEAFALQYTLTRANGVLFALLGVALGGASSSEMLARFEREVRITAALTHPNTVAIYDYGKTPDGTFYYAMELLGGHNLDTLVERVGPLPPARVVHLLLQACGSLHEAHSAGLIHRDIKPANLIVCELTAGGASGPTCRMR
jgi:serine/threonine protein kinase